MTPRSLYSVGGSRVKGGGQFRIFAPQGEQKTGLEPGTMLEEGPRSKSEPRSVTSRVLHHGSYMVRIRPLRVGDPTAGWM